MPKLNFDIRKLRHLCAAAVIAIAVGLAMFNPLPASAAPSKWETPKQERTDTRVIIRENDVEIKAARGVIVVSAPKPVQIKVYTILGQLVSRETLPAGTSQLNVQAHGVYIIRTADLTCKVAL